MRASSTICSPANAIQVKPAAGQATWISHSGRSAGSEVLFHAKRVNSSPAQTNTSAQAKKVTDLSTTLSSVDQRLVALQSLVNDTLLKIRVSPTP